MFNNKKKLLNFPSDAIPMKISASLSVYVCTDKFQNFDFEMDLESRHSRPDQTVMKQEKD